MRLGIGIGIGLGGASNPPTGFVLTDISSGRLFQRTKSLTTGPVSAAGTYSGGTPNAIQLQVLKVSDDSVIKDWTTASATIAGGAWSATITGVTQGGSYYVKARPANATSLAATGSNPFYVGILIVMYGQSNMVFMSSVTSSPPAATAGTTYFDGSAWGAVPDGNGVRELLNGLIAATGSVPCAALNGAVSGVPISSLEAGAGYNYYEDLAAQITTAGGDAEFIIWHQGEGDAAGPTAEATYKTALSGIHTSLSTLVGRTKAQIPLALSSLSTNTNTASSDANWDAIQTALRNCEGAITAVYYSHSNMDAPLSDGTHWTAAGYGNSGKRYARTLAYLLGAVATRPRWFIASAATVDGTHTDVTLTHVMGTDFTPTSAITGFEASGDNGGSWVTPSAAARTSATVINLTHSSIATTSSRKLRYQYGHSAVVSAPVVDNGALTVPLDRTAGSISPTPLSATPVPTYRTKSALSTGTTCTVAGLNIVNAGADLVLVVTVAVASPRALAATAPTITPNGGSAINGTIVQNDSANCGAAIIQFSIPNGTDLTNATFGCTYTSAVFSFPYAGFWTIPVADLSSTTPVDSKSATSAGATVISVTNLTTTANGCVIAVSSSASTGNSCTWTGTDTLNERYDTVSGGNDHTGSDTSSVTASAGSYSVTATFTPNSVAGRTSAVSYR